MTFLVKQAQQAQKKRMEKSSLTHFISPILLLKTTNYNFCRYSGWDFGAKSAALVVANILKSWSTLQK